MRGGPLAAVVLAAGGGTRFVPAGNPPVVPAGRSTLAPAAGAPVAPTHKLLAEFRGRPLVAWALEAALEAQLARTWVVTGAVDLAGVVPAGVEVLANPAWASGQASSLQVAITAAYAAGLSGVVVGLGDQPMVPASAWRAVADGPGPIVVATYGGRRRNPVRLDRGVWPELAAAGDEGARALMRLRPGLVRGVACAGDPADIDTVEDLHRWN